MRYELKKGTSNKFWEIELAGKVVTTTYGRIGAKGQKTIKKLATPAAANVFHDRLVAEKTRKGYAPVKAAPPALVKRTPPRAPGTPAWDIALAFQPKKKIVDDGTTYAVELVALPHLVVTSGQLFACDPFTMFGAGAFERKVRKGKHPVTLSIAKMTGRIKDRRVGAVMVRFAKGAVAKWINVTKRGQKIAKLKPGYSFGYGVDAGVGCIADAAILPNLNLVDDIVRENDGAEGWLYPLMDEHLSENNWAQAILDSKTKANILVFYSGFGDGFYPSYWGLSKSGAPLCFVPDFGVYPRPETI
jgi:predicted DNA-binding WGR domain protein